MCAQLRVWTTKASNCDLWLSILPTSTKDNVEGQVTQTNRNHAFVFNLPEQNSLPAAGLSRDPWFSQPHMLLINLFAEMRRSSAHWATTAAVLRWQMEIRQELLAPINVDDRVLSASETPTSTAATEPRWRVAATTRTPWWAAEFV